MKKFLLGIAVFITTAIICIVSAGAETYGDYEYEVLSDGTVEITKYTGDDTEVEIPSEIDGKKVTSIGYRAFYFCDSLVSVTVPDSVTSIGDYAFAGCTSLASVNISDSVTSIGGCAFYECTSLTSIDIPSNVTSIGSYAFCNCSSLASVTIPDSVTSINSRTFAGCTSLTSITIPDSVTNIGDCAFEGCTSLASVTIPDSVTNIGNMAFYGCESLESIIIPDSVTSIDSRAFANCTSLASINVDSANKYYTSINGVLFDKNKTTLIAYPAGKTNTRYAIPSGVISISGYAFADCSSLTYVTIPDSVISIGDCAFSGCTSFTSFNIPDGVTSIGNGAFFNCSLTSIIIPDSVTSISNSCFEHCSSLTTVSIPDSVTSIGDYAFYGCSSLTSIEIPDSVTSIDDWAFFYCPSLTSITIPDNVTSIGRGAFSNCPSLSSINVGVDNQYYSSVDGVLFNKDKTVLLAYPNGKSKNYSIPDGVISIGYGAFRYSGLISVTIPDSVTNIESYAFDCCSSLLSLTIHDGVTSIGSGAMGYCYSIIPIKVEDFVLYCQKNTVAHQYALNNELKYILLDAPAAPSAVTGFKLGGRASNALRLNWTKNTSADGYIIEQYKSGKWVRIAKITNPATTTYRVTGLKAGTAYKFRMRAYKMDGSKALYSSYTSTLSARTNPSNITGYKLGGRAADALRLNWTKNTSADGYIVEQYKSGKWVRVAKITSNATTTYKISGLKASTQYKFRVKAYKMSGKTALYSGYTSTLSAYTNPSKVANLKITGKATTALRLGWSKNTSADGYIIEMYKDGKWVRAAKIASNATVTFRKSGLKKGTTYKFRVRTYNMVGKTALYGNYVNVSGTTNK